jgi:hypothetical protein
MRGISTPWGMAASAGVLAECRMATVILLRVSGNGKKNEHHTQRCAQGGRIIGAQVS